MKMKLALAKARSCVNERAIDAMTRSIEQLWCSCERVTAGLEGPIKTYVFARIPRGGGIASPNKAR